MLHPALSFDTPATMAAACKRPHEVHSSVTTVGGWVQMSRLDQEVTWSRSLDGNEYMPGLLGLNNMKHNDYANAAVQILSRVGPVRDFFLQASNYADVSSPLVQRFGELLRKMWNPRNFKGQVRAASPLFLPQVTQIVPLAACVWRTVSSARCAGRSVHTSSCKA